MQEAFATHFASQCGYCTPGMIMTAKAFLATNPTPTEDEVRQAIRGNLCRCTGYSRIVDAIMAASGQTVKVREYRPSEHKVVGQSLPRADSHEKVTGQGGLRVRHAAARDAARRDPAQPAPVTRGS